MHGPHEHHDRHQGALRTGAVALAALAGGYAIYRLMARRNGRPAEPEDAPAKTLRGHPAEGWREDTVVGRTVTINRPRGELYAFWREFSNLPRFMEHVKSVEGLDDGRSRWIIKAPTGSLEFETRITEEREGELIAWASEEDAPIRNSGRIEFRDAPGGRGTQVDATIAYDAPGGAAGRLIAKIFQKEPKLQARRELKRFKQLMETGEVATSEVTGEPPVSADLSRAAGAPATQQDADEQDPEPQQKQT